MSDTYSNLINTIRQLNKRTVDVSDVPLLSDVEWRYSRICSTIRNVHEQRKEIEKHERDQLTVGTYKTKNFEMCPKAQLLYANLPKETDPAPAEKSAILQDQLFALEKTVMARQAATQQDLDTARDLYKRIMLFAKQLDMVDKHDYLQDHINKIEKFSKNNTPEVFDSEEEAEKAISSKFEAPPYDRVVDPKKDMDLDSKKFLIRRNLAAQRKIKIIDGD